jgi:nucleoside-diphosphate-sugar epimerase
VVSAPALVTGATGGLGRVLVAQLLARGCKVVATGRNRATGALLEAAGARFVPADLASDDVSGLLAGVGTVFHLAALSSPYGRERDFVAANVTATRRLLAAARAAGCAGFVFTSTPSIYARPQDQIAITEATPLPPGLANAYARTKLEAERMVLAEHGTAMACIALRPRAILSPYDTTLLPRLLRAADKGVMPLPHGGRALLEPTDARDVVSALLAARAFASKAGGRVYNISSGVSVSLRDLVTELFRQLDRDVRLLSCLVVCCWPWAPRWSALPPPQGRPSHRLQPMARSYWAGRKPSTCPPPVMRSTGLHATTL